MDKRRSGVTCRIAIIVVVGALLGMAGCGEESPWVPIGPEDNVHGALDVPLGKLHEEPEDFIGTVFEDQFKFYHIYHDREDADPTLRGQVIAGETHFTARPVKQHLQVVQIQITPAQEAWIRERGIQRQDALRLRVRFKGIAPGSVLAFELLEVLDAPTPRSKT